MVGKQAWSIAMKEDNLWVKWVHVMYVKEHDWSQFKVPNSASWALKFIYKVKQDITTRCGNDWLQNHQFRIASLYQQLYNSRKKLIWRKDVWDHHNIPKHGYISWLAMRQRLQTRSRLYHFGVCSTNQCLLCGREE